MKRQIISRYLRSFRTEQTGGGGSTVQAGTDRADGRQTITAGLWWGRDGPERGAGRRLGLCGGMCA